MGLADSAAVGTNSVEFQYVAHFCVSELVRDRFQLRDFAVVETLGLVALSADDVMVMVLVPSEVELKKRFARFRWNPGGDAGGIEGFQVSVDGNQIVALGSEGDVGFFGGKRLSALDQDLEESLAGFGDAAALPF